VTDIEFRFRHPVFRNSCQQTDTKKVMMMTMTMTRTTRVDEDPRRDSILRTCIYLAEHCACLEENNHWDQRKYSFTVYIFKDTH
jgi:hypothetical protein